MKWGGWEGCGCKVAIECGLQVEHLEIVSLDGKYWRHGYIMGRECTNIENPLKASLGDKG
jgi:hypothetical protein